MSQRRHHMPRAAASPVMVDERGLCKFCSSERDPNVPNGARLCRACFLHEKRELGAHYRQKNRDKERERSRRYYQDNRGKVGETQKRYRENNRGKEKEKKNARRARKLNASGSFTAQEWHDVCAHYNHTCLCCGASGVRLTADHVVPLSKGGSNDISNIQPLCISCNCRKYTKIIDYRIRKEAA
jgi:5-methylcytosine-specific restriction endonuclease McrA